MSNRLPLGNPALGMVAIILLDKSRNRMFSRRDRSTFRLREVMLLLDKSRYCNTSLGPLVNETILLSFNTSFFKLGQISSSVTLTDDSELAVRSSEVSCVGRLDGQTRNPRDLHTAVPLLLHVHNNGSQKPELLTLKINWIGMCRKTTLLGTLNLNWNTLPVCVQPIEILSSLDPTFPPLWPGLLVV